MKPLYAVITHNNRTVHIEEFDDDTITNLKKYFEGCIHREISKEELSSLEDDWYLYLELDQDNTYTFELYHPEIEA